jgi:hypothetical protein
MQQPHPTRPSRRARPVLAVALVLIGAGAASVLWFVVRDDVPAPAGPELWDAPGVREPPACSADSVELPDDARLIAVSAGGRHRAYALEALLARDRHVVNDTLGGVPITVTYCDRSDCAQVFTAPEGDQPLDVAVGGWVGQYETGSLLLRVGGARYRQDTGQPLEPDAPPFPYARADFVRTTWKQWHEAYPDGDVYVGRQMPGDDEDTPTTSN